MPGAGSELEDAKQRLATDADVTSSRMDSFVKAYYSVQAMSLMLPKNTPRRQLPDEATLESRMDCMKVTSSYSCAALNNVNLDAILDDIKCNLRKEQHTVLELNWHVLYHVLAPIQVIPSAPLHLRILTPGLRLGFSA